MTTPSLNKEIRAEVDRIEIINPHTHLREDCLTSHIVDILSYHWILSELNSVGMDYDQVFTNPTYSLEDRLKSVIPYFSRMRNTSTARCVYSITRDLYGFDDELDESNYLKLLDSSIKKSSQTNWPDQVFHRSHITALATSVGNASDRGNERENFFLMVDLHYLFWPDGATDLLPWFDEFAGDSTRYLSAIESLGGIEISKATDIRLILDTFLREVRTGRTKFFNTFLPIDFRFLEMSDDLVDRAIQSFRKSHGKSADDLDVLTAFVTWTILEILNEMDATLQIAVGAEYFICGGRSVSRFESSWVSDMVKICHRFPEIRFDFMNASAVMNHEMAVAAKMIRNFYLQPMWWHTYVPAYIQFLDCSLDIVPVVKLGGFYCDAYYCELTYGKLQMVKEALVDVLAGKVKQKVFTLDYAIQVAKLLLKDNPVARYDL